MRARAALVRLCPRQIPTLVQSKTKCLSKATPDTLRQDRTQRGGFLSSSRLRAQPSTTWCPRKTQAQSQDSEEGSLGVFLPHGSSVEDAVWAAHSPADFGCPGHRFRLNDSLSDLWEAVFSASGCAFAKWRRCRARPRGATRRGKPGAQPRGRAHSPLGPGSGRLCSQDGGRRLWCAHSGRGRPCARGLSLFRPRLPWFINNSLWLLPFPKHRKGFVPARFRALLEGTVPCGPWNSGHRLPLMGPSGQITGFCFVLHFEINL